MQRAQFINIFLVVFIVLLGFGLIMPLMPFYAAAYGASDLLVGLLVASYAAAQFVGAPLLGRLSDRVGRRPILIVSMLGTALGFLLLAVAEPAGRALAGVLSPAPSTGLQNAAILGVMFLSRFVSGMAGGMITVAQAYIADVTDESNRTQGMGMIGAAFGLGFILGPVIGGVLSRWGYDVPAFAAAAMAALNLLTIWFLLPESLTQARKAELAQQKRQPAVDFAGMVRQLGRPRLGPLLVIRMIVSIAASLFMALFTLWAKNRLGLDARVSSYLMAYNGVLTIIVQIGLIGPLTHRFAEARLITWCTAILGAAMLGWGLTGNVPLLMVVMIPLALATGVLNTVINSAVSWSVAPREVGDALGTAAAYESLSRVIAPPLGGWLLGAVGLWAPGVLGGVLLAGLTLFALRRLIVHPDPPPAVPAWLAGSPQPEPPAALDAVAA